MYVWVDSQLDSNLQTTFPVGILEHVGKWRLGIYLPWKAEETEYLEPT